MRGCQPGPEYIVFVYTGSESQGDEGIEKRGRKKQTEQRDKGNFVSDVNSTPRSYQVSRIYTSENEEKMSFFFFF